MLLYDGILSRNTSPSLDTADTFSCMSPSHTCAPGTNANGCTGRPALEAGGVKPGTAVVGTHRTRCLQSATMTMSCRPPSVTTK